MTRLLWYNPIPNTHVSDITDNLIDFKIGAEVISKKRDLERELRQIVNAQQEKSSLTYSGREETPFVILDIPPCYEITIKELYRKRFSFPTPKNHNPLHFPFYFIPIHTDNIGIKYQQHPFPKNRIAQHISDEISGVLTHLMRSEGRHYLPHETISI